MRKIYVVIFIYAAGACSVKTETTDPADSTTLIENDTSGVADTSEEDDFNSQDYGDPGLDPFRVSRDTLDESIKIFIDKIVSQSFDELIDSRRSVLVLTPGPGLYPITTFAQTKKELQAAQLPELKSITADVKLDCYKMMPPRCYVIENYPDGIFFTETTLNFQDIVTADGQNDADVEEFRNWSKDKPGFEILIKFTTRGEQTFIDFLTFKKGNHLFLAAIDQRDCGA